MWGLYINIFKESTFENFEMSELRKQDHLLRAPDSLL